MTLEEAVHAAFGRTHHVRREQWPKGSGGAINYLPGAERGLDVIWFTFGGKLMVVPKSVDLEADDWYPCTLSGDPATEDWRDVLSVTDGGEKRSIGPGNRCKVTLDGRRLEGECELAWAEPYTIMLAVANYASGWPDEGMMIPTGNLVLSANGIDLAFDLLQVSWWYPSDGIRLYHLMVVPAQRN